MLAPTVTLMLSRAQGLPTDTVRAAPLLPVSRFHEQSAA